MEDKNETNTAGIKLDWDKLLPSDDADPPPLLVLERTKKKKRKIVEVKDDGDDDEDKSLEERFRGVSDREMADRLERLKKTSGLSTLSDGGEKCRISIKRHEAELERRRRVLNSRKDDEKCKKPGEFYDLSCPGKFDGARIEMPVQDNNRSLFSQKFIKKMEPKARTPFRTTLNHLDNQKIKSNGSRSSAGRPKLGSSSRQTPFRCPSTLSTNSDKDTVREDDKALCTVSTSVSVSKDPLAEESSKRRNASRVRPTCDSRRHNTVVLVDEDEAEIAEADQQIEGVDECKKDARIYYPSRDDAESVEICYSDLDCLASEAYLTSTIINFYIRYLQQHIYLIRKEGEDYHFFNTYFYEKLRKAILKKNDVEAFSKIRRWWKGVKLFERAYIFLPIHANYHWSLVIICVHDKKDGSGPSILHLDSLGLHSSNLIFENIRRFLIGEWEFLKKNEAHMPDPPFPENIWNHFPRRINVKAIEVPQQGNEYDCGPFVLFFIERFIEKAPRRMKKEDLEMLGTEWFKPVKASLLREKIQHLLRDEFNKEKEENQTYKSLSFEGEDPAST